MNVRKPRPQAAQDEQTPYRAPQKLIGHCPVCRVTVLLGVAKAGGVIEWQEPPLTPILGQPHACAQATT